MKKKLTIIFLFFTLLSYSQTKILPNTLIVKFKNSAQKGNEKKLQKIQNILNSDFNHLLPMFANHSNMSKKSTNNLTNIYLIKTKGKQNIYNYLQNINNLDNVEYACPYYLPELLGKSANDPQTGSQYYLSLTKVFDAHVVTTGDTNIVVGILDSGVDIEHEDLKDNIKYNYADPINGKDDDKDGFVDNYYGWDIADNDNNPNPKESSHGTMVAGLVAATGNNSKGIYGIGGKTKILPIKIIDSEGYLSGSYQAIVYAANMGCNIINCSWGSQTKNPLCDDVIDYAINEKNCLVVAAAGNAQSNVPYYPAACNGVLSVAASNSADIKWVKSTYGIEVDICAPGEQVFTTGNNNTYKPGWGTSFASPIVSGCAALVKAKNPDLTPLQIAEQLRVTSDIVDTLPENKVFNHLMGKGRLNAFKAVTADTLPSLRITQLKYVGKNAVPMPKDTIKITFTATNYLAQVSNTAIRLSVDKEYGKTENNIFTTGKMATMQKVSNADNAMSLIIDKNIKHDQIIELNFEFAGNKYKDYQSFKLPVNQSFVNVENKYLQTSFTSNGTIGFTNMKKNLGKGLIYNNSNWLLAESGILMGNSNINIVSALPDDLDFGINKVVDTIITNDSIVGYSVFYPNNPDKDLPVIIEQTSKIYNKEPFNKMVFHEYKVINKGAKDIENFAFAVFTNWDLDNEAKNHVEYNKESNLIFAKSTSKNNLFAGVVLLNKKNCVPYAFDLKQGGNGGVDITSGFTDEDKWQTMTNARPNDNNLEDKINTASMITAPMQTLKYNDTLNYVFAFAVADTYMELIENVNKAKEKYEKKYTISSSKLVTLNNKLKIEPNPATNFVKIQLPNDDKISNCLIYNQSGQLVLNLKTNKNPIEHNVSNLKSGVYIVKTYSKQRVFVGKLIISK